MSEVYIAIGSNIDPNKHLHEVADLLRKEWLDIQFSHVYKTSAREVEEQPDFLNAAGRFSTHQDPSDVLTLLREMEKHLSKNIAYRFGPRTLDLDLLLFGNKVLPNESVWLQHQCKPIDEQTERLYVPHLRMHERAFVLAPLSDLISLEDLHPVFNKTWGELLRGTDEQHCIKVEYEL